VLDVHGVRDCDAHRGLAVRVRGSRRSAGLDRAVGVGERRERRRREHVAKRAGGGSPGLVQGADGLPTARAVPERAALGVEGPLARFDDLDEADRVGWPDEAVAAVASGPGAREAGAHEVGEDLRGEGLGNGHLGHDLAELAVLPAVVGACEAQRRPHDVVAPLRQRHVHGETLAARLT